MSGLQPDPAAGCVPAKPASCFRLGSLLTLLMLKTTRRLALLALSGVAALVLAPQVSHAEAITVGSKDFTEQFILGEMYALTLEAAGFTVERKLNLGGTPVAHAGLLSGEIDLYPEYTGTGLLTVLKLPTSSDPAEVYKTVAREYEAQFQLIWLDPAPMNNTQALAMTRTRAEELGITTLSDMAAKASQLVMIGPPEFQAREDGLPGLQAVYGNFRLKEYKAVDPGLRYRGLVNGEADVAVAFGTDGEIAAFDLVVLEDDKQLFPPYQVAPVVRQDTLQANPGIADALNALSPLLTNEVMQELNYEVSGNQREPADVARAFLVEAGILAE
ncbi:MAG: glycine betaine ABC transporter substrate-binding protein [Thermostichus sp. DG02_4_bins_136]